MTLDEKIAYGTVQINIEHREDLIVGHKEAGKITLEKAVMGSPVPYHPGAIKYYPEKKARPSGPGRK